MGLGIGANAAIFSVVNGVLLKPLPYADGDELVALWQHEPLAGNADIGFSYKEILDYRTARSLESVVEFHNMWFILLGRSEPQRVSTGVVSANFFDVLGVTPMFGRTFVDADDKPGAPAVLVLSHAYWKRSFGGDPHDRGQGLSDERPAASGHRRFFRRSRSIRRRWTSTCRRPPARSDRTRGRSRTETLGWSARSHG